MGSQPQGLGLVEGIDEAKADNLSFALARASTEANATEKDD